MPKKQDFVLFCKLAPAQQEIYEKLFQMEDFQLINKKDERCDCGFVSFTKLSQVCFIY